MAKGTCSHDLRKDLVTMVAELEHRSKVASTLQEYEYACIGNPWGSNTKLEFPHFNGEGLKGLLLRSEYFFEVGRITLENRVKVAALQLEGKAIEWHQGFVKIKGSEAYESWDEYVKVLGARFGSHPFDDSLAELRNLR
ncbi:hypothetical protein GH714_036672 [Hevea brasiliensis]|uniref:Retrotransposon gag domain-containing protein n=1 Tax=Hevea brasiliensis TaxID=3981 RepID=A0A6A6KVV1_HEVBR|nr:hypothetical protein GH714_036672 [Hevea brasiliensis]